MRITSDSIERARALSDRGLDFEDAAIVCKGITVEVEDTRTDYGERRIICYGLLAGRAPPSRASSFRFGCRSMSLKDGRLPALAGKRALPSG